MQAENREPTLTDVLDELRAVRDELKGDIARIETELGASNARIDKWEERFLQLSRDNLSIARTVIIAASTVVILGSLLDKAEVLIAGISRLLGKS
jgi:hypothetical protein